MLAQGSEEGSYNPSHTQQPNKAKPKVLQTKQSSPGGCSPEQSPLPWLCQPPCCRLGSLCTHIPRVGND